MLLGRERYDARRGVEQFEQPACRQKKFDGKVCQIGPAKDGVSERVNLQSIIQMAHKVKSV